jgi:lipopolysaccharide export system permease protein
MKIVDRYVLSELARPAIFGLLIFSSLWLVNVLMRMIDLLVTKEVPLPAVVKIFAYTLPVVMTTSCPMAMLLAALMAIGRITSDSELTALKAGGVGLVRVLVPVAVVGIVASASVFALNELVVPEAQIRRNQIYVNEVMLKKPLPKISENIFFDGGGSELKMFVRRFDSKANRMKDVTVYHFETGGFPRITEARTAILSDKEWTFHRGTMYTSRPNGSPEHFIHFGTWRYPLDLQMIIEPKTLVPRPSDMALADLVRHIREQEAKGLPTTVLWVDLFWKTSFPFASLFLMLMAAPLAAGSGRAGASMGVGFSIVLMFGYYMLLALFRGGGEAGHLTPFWAAWGPNSIVLAIAAFLIHRAAR